MNSGKFNVYCDFQKPTKVSDSGGGSTITWANQFYHWGGFAFLNLSRQMEAIAAGKVTSATGAVLTVYANSLTELIDNTWRVVEGGRTWNIRGVNPPVDGKITMIVETGVPT